jgi:ubiquitin-protein ligase
MINRIQQKRLRKDVEQLHKEPLEYIKAYQSAENMLDFYFLINGQNDTIYDGGKYIGKIILSKDYPSTPPDIMFLTPNGRFQINVKICLSITGFHKDEWNASLTIQGMLIQLYSIFCDDDTHGIGHIRESDFIRKEHATRSNHFNIANYNEIYSNFTEINDSKI